MTSNNDNFSPEDLTGQWAETSPEPRIDDGNPYAPSAVDLTKWKQGDLSEVERVRSQHMRYEMRAYQLGTTTRWIAMLIPVFMTLIPLVIQQSGEKAVEGLIMGLLPGGLLFWIGTHLRLLDPHVRWIVLVLARAMAISCVFAFLIARMGLKNGFSLLITPMAVSGLVISILILSNFRGKKMQYVFSDAYVSIIEATLDMPFSAASPLKSKTWQRRIAGAVFLAIFFYVMMYMQ